MRAYRSQATGSLPTPKVGGAAFLALAVGAFAIAWVRGSEAREPWRPGDVLTPKQLNTALKGPRKPRVVCVSFDQLYDAAHVPGAVYKGPGREARGLESLKAWAKTLDRKTEIVLYCGCCPWSQCPNIRPAFRALKAMGFTRLKVMEIKEDFHTDWVKAGYPT